MKGRAPADHAQSGGSRPLHAQRYGRWALSLAYVLPIRCKRNPSPRQVRTDSGAQPDETGDIERWLRSPISSLVARPQPYAGQFVVEAN